MDRLFSLLKLIELQVKKDMHTQHSNAFELPMQFVCSSLHVQDVRLVSSTHTNVTISLVQDSAHSLS